MYTDTVPILRGHLEELHRAVEGAATYHGADDLARKAKNLGGVHRPSNLTTALEASLERIEGYLAMEVTEDDGLQQE